MIEETNDAGLIAGRGADDTLAICSFKIRSDEFEVFSVG